MNLKLVISLFAVLTLLSSTTSVANAAKTSPLQQTVDLHTLELSNLKTSYSLLDIKVGAHDTSILNINSDIVRLQTEQQLSNLPGMKLAIQSNTEDISLLNSRLAITNLKVAAIDSSMNELLNTTNNLSEKVSKLENNATRIPLVKDGTGKIIGSLIGMAQPGQDSNRFDIYVPSVNAIFPVNPTTGRMHAFGEGRVYFEGTDCTGQAYDGNQPNYYVRGSTYLNKFYVPDGSAPTSAIVNSLMENGGCRGDRLGLNEALKMIEVAPNFTLPLTLPLAITSSF